MCIRDRSSINRVSIDLKHLDHPFLFKNEMILTLQRTIPHVTQQLSRRHAIVDDQSQTHFTVKVS